MLRNSKNVSRYWNCRWRGVYCWVIFQPKVRTASKYDRQVDLRTFGDKKHLFSGVSPFSVRLKQSRSIWSDFLTPRFTKADHIHQHTKYFFSFVSTPAKQSTSWVARFLKVALMHSFDRFAERLGHDNNLYNYILQYLEHEHGCITHYAKTKKIKNGVQQKFSSLERKSSQSISVISPCLVIVDMVVVSSRAVHFKIRFLRIIISVTSILRVAG